MKEIEIGEFFKEKLSDSVQAPPADLWNGILQDPTLQRFNRTRRLRRLALRVALPALAVAITLAALLLAPSSSNPPANSSHNCVTASKSVVYTEKSSATATTSDALKTAVPTAKPAATLPQNTPISPAEPNLPTPVTTPVIPIVNEPAPTLPLMVSLPHHQPMNLSTFPSTSTHSLPAKSTSNDIFKQDAGGGLDTNGQLSGALSYSHDTSVCRNSKVKLYVYNADNVFWSCGSQSAEVELYVSEPLTIRADIRTVDKRDTAIFVRIGVYDCELFIPTAFTPNGDGLNDEWLVSAPADYSHYECVVKDKSGRILFQTKNIHQGWDGKSNGQYLPLGAYHYICRFRDEMGEQHIQQGQVMIIR